MKKVTAEVIEKNRYLVTVEVEDNATDGDKIEIEESEEK